MKKLIFIFLLLSAISVRAQRQCCIDVMIAPSSVFEYGVDAFVDLGTGTDNSTGYLKVGDKAAFYSTMEIVNYFTGKGWKLSHVLEINIGIANSGMVRAITGVKEDFKFPHYIFEKEASSLEEAVDGIELVPPKEIKKQKRTQRKSEREEKDGADDLYYIP